LTLKMNTAISFQTSVNYMQMYKATYAGKIELLWLNFVSTSPFMCILILINLRIYEVWVVGTG